MIYALTVMVSFLLGFLYHQHFISKRMDQIKDKCYQEGVDATKKEYSEHWQRVSDSRRMSGETINDK